MRPPTNATNVLLSLLAIRILNAFTVETFFQPDEYFQSLEPAWQIAFGKQSGAWITWVGEIPFIRSLDFSGFFNDIPSVPV